MSIWQTLTDIYPVKTNVSLLSGYVKKFDTIKLGKSGFNVGLQNERQEVFSKMYVNLVIPKINRKFDSVHKSCQKTKKKKIIHLLLYKKPLLYS